MTQRDTAQHAEVPFMWQVSTNKNKLCKLSAGSKGVRVTIRVQVQLWEGGTERPK